MNRVMKETMKILQILVPALCLWLAGPDLGLAQEKEEGTSSAVVKGEGAAAVEKKIGAAGPVQAMTDRLEALEKEEDKLHEMAGKLEAGETVNLDELWQSWVQPAIYLIDIPDPLEKYHEEVAVTDAAAAVAESMLEKKESEYQDLIDLKSEMERGSDMLTSEIVGSDEMGMDSHLQELQDTEAEVRRLKEQLEKISFEKRFRHVAKQPLLEEAPMDPEAVAQGSSSQGEEPGSPREKVPGDPATLPGAGPGLPGETAEAAPEGEGMEEPINLPQSLDLASLADTHYRLGRFKRARQIYEKIDVAAHTEGDRILYMIARCTESLGEFKEAIKDYNDVSKVFPDTFWAKESAFAVSLVAWKEDLGVVKGVPDEAQRVLDSLAESRKAREEAAAARDTDKTLKGSKAQ